MAVKYGVCVIDWGQKREYEYFDTVEKAIEYRDRINSYNTVSTIAPDWYMVAEQEIRIVEE